MCRLFGMAAGSHRVTATFWLLEAPDSLAEQSRREPDGTGLGWFADDGTPSIDKQPLAAYEDAEFTRRAHEVRSNTFVAHVRYASTGGLDERNTHPFEQERRLFAHNGVIEGLDQLEEHLGDARSLVEGDTDSERFFALITKETRAAGGDVGAGIQAAARWIAAELPVFAMNLILITDGNLYALRYPDTHDLFLLQRAAGGPSGCRHLEQASAAGRIRVRAGALATDPAVVLATERMDDDPGWQELEPGVLVHVDAGLNVHRTTILDGPPRHLLTLADLGATAAASQRP
jgi:predicted glutamine amidotransferase